MKTMKNLTALLLFSSTAGAQQFHMLHYSETSGFDHSARAQSLAMFQALAAANDFLVTDDQTGDAFNSLAQLQQYAVVVFSNTSGDAILDVSQRANFESYISSGGSFLGIHAASDTYRHSTANGSNTGTWDFYAELVGASVQENPNHVAGTPEYAMAHIGSHPSVSNIPNPWVKNEEYYYWENGFFGTDNMPVLEVEQTTGPNGLQNSYDAPRPMSWHRTLSSGGRVFYTALGHAASNFTSDQHFIDHISQALLWTAGLTIDVPATAESATFRVVHHPDRIQVLTNGRAVLRMELIDLNGRTVCSSIGRSDIFTGGMVAGMYLLRTIFHQGAAVRKVVVSSYGF